LGAATSQAICGKLRSIERMAIEYRKAGDCLLQNTEDLREAKALLDQLSDYEVEGDAKDQYRYKLSLTDTAAFVCF
jgi:hypothetical protein